MRRGSGRAARTGTRPTRAASTWWARPPAPTSSATTSTSSARPATCDSASPRHVAFIAQLLRAPGRRRPRLRHRQPGQRRHATTTSRTSPRRRSSSAASARTTITRRTRAGHARQPDREQPDPRRSGSDYSDAAGIYIGFTTRLLVAHNEIYDVPWAGIAIGWGWGLLRPRQLPRAPGTVQRQVGPVRDADDRARGNRILHNRIHGSSMELWDGGAIYTLGRQGTRRRRRADRVERRLGQAAARRAATSSTPTAAAATSRCFRTCRSTTRRASPTSAPAACRRPFRSAGSCFPYGTDMRRLRAVWRSALSSNYWQSSLFFNVCPYKDHPVNLILLGNQIIGSDGAGAPEWILRSAGRQTPHP